MQENEQADYGGQSRPKEENMKKRSYDIATWQYSDCFAGCLFV
jgi:hypothetical protein